MDEKRAEISFQDEQQALVLIAGADTAYYNVRPTDRDFQPVRQELDLDLQEELEALKRLAQERDELISTRWSFEGQTLFMRDKGGSQFKWILENDFIVLSIGRGRKTGIVGQVRLSSEFLWSCLADHRGDLSVALSKVHTFLRSFYGEYIQLDQSSLDLAVDVLFLDLDGMKTKECFISRAVLDEERPVHIDDGYVDGPSSIRRRWKKLAGLSFGMHSSAVSAVIYNKTHEIKYHSPEKMWFHDLWKRAAQEKYSLEWDESMIVWRVEVRFRRISFREFPEVSGAYDVLDHLCDLWTYGVGHPGGGVDGLPDGWLRYVVPNDDTNRARWPVHPAWEVIQAAFLPEAVPESDYQREEREQEEYWKLVDEELKARPMRTTVHKRKKKAVASASAVPSPVVPPDAQPFDVQRFQRKRKREVNMKRALDQVAGWIATIEAWRRGYEVDAHDENAVEPDLSDTFHFLYERVMECLEKKEVDFSFLVNKKRVLYRLQEASA